MTFEEHKEYYKKRLQEGYGGSQEAADKAFGIEAEDLRKSIAIEGSKTGKNYEFIEGRENSNHTLGGLMAHVMLPDDPNSNTRSSLGMFNAGQIVDSDSETTKGIKKLYDVKPTIVKISTNPNVPKELLDMAWSKVEATHKNWSLGKRYHAVFGEKDKLYDGKKLTNEIIQQVKANPEAFEKYKSVIDKKDFNFNIEYLGGYRKKYSDPTEKVLNITRVPFYSPEEKKKAYAFSHTTPEYLGALAYINEETRKRWSGETQPAKKSNVSKSMVIDGKEYNLKEDFKKYLHSTINSKSEDEIKSAVLSKAIEELGEEDAAEVYKNYTPEQYKQEAINRGLFKTKSIYQEAKMNANKKKEYVKKGYNEANKKPISVYFEPTTSIERQEHATGTAKDLSLSRFRGSVKAAMEEENTLALLRHKIREITNYEKPEDFRIGYNDPYPARIQEESQKQNESYYYGNDQRESNVVSEDIKHNLAVKEIETQHKIGQTIRTFASSNNELLTEPQIDQLADKINNENKTWNYLNVAKENIGNYKGKIKQVVNNAIKRNTGLNQEDKSELILTAVKGLGKALSNKKTKEEVIQERKEMRQWYETKKTKGLFTPGELNYINTDVIIDKPKDNVLWRHIQEGARKITKTNKDGKFEPSKYIATEVKRSISKSKSLKRSLDVNIPKNLTSLLKYNNEDMKKLKEEIINQVISEEDYKYGK